MHIIRPSNTRRIRRPQISDHEGLCEREVTWIAGLPVVGRADTWADLHATVELRDLIAMGDGIARLPGGPEELAAALAWRVRRRCAGVVTLRAAHAHVRPNSRSPMQSIGRWVMVSGGVPEPLLNYDIKDRAG